MPKGAEWGHSFEVPQDLQGRQGLPRPDMDAVAVVVAAVVVAGAVVADDGPRGIDAAEVVTAKRVVAVVAVESYQKARSRCLGAMQSCRELQGLQGHLGLLAD